MSSTTSHASSSEKQIDALGSRLCACLGAGLGAFEPSGPEADQRADDRAELGRLVVAQVGALQHRHVSLGVLVDDDRVDHAHDVVLLQPVELGQDLALEVRFVEPQHQKLYGSDCHVPLLSQLKSSIADAKGEDIARRPDSPG